MGSNRRALCECRHHWGFRLCSGHGALRPRESDARERIRHVRVHARCCGADASPRSASERTARCHRRHCIGCGPSIRRRSAPLLGVQGGHDLDGPGASERARRHRRPSQRSLPRACRDRYDAAAVRAGARARH
eukprot:Amastigsp_a1863_25.p4 type:complete len:133 gc:universal Amastigsp_a1863_25:240-638(+)